MSERVLNPHEIRIVPGSGAARPALAATPSNTRIVQLFRLLAEQAATSTERGPGFGSSTADVPADEPALDERTEAATTAPPHDAHADGPPPMPPTGHEPQHAPADRTTRAARAHEAPARVNDIANADLGKQITHLCATAMHAEVFARELAERIARFCQTSGTADDMAWAVTLPMNPAVLPDTLLHLQLSPVSLAIRFETSSPRSAQLLSENKDALRVRLNETLDRRLDIGIDIAA